MRYKIRFLLVSCLTSFVLCACSADDAYVIVDIQGDQISLGPDEQDPDASYALTEVTVDRKTRIYGERDNQSALTKDDVIRFEFRKDQEPVVETIEHGN
ncbi:hypothetical protein [Exiguobacterium oxidotolerans]|uniref:hypothetical protein n=1 Tax=Exiguobacterium oxidotolerans TaxID=223958 RepID=UPI0004948B05|nr:hypothetical protein [Exiguobacterium oxidotolerans]